MSNVGPVCHIPPKNTTGDPQPHAIPGIPGAINPNSPSFNNDVANMLNALRQLLLRLSGQLNDLNKRQDTFQGVLNGFKTKPDSNAQWQQSDQQTEKVKVYQNNDPTSDNWVEIERTTSLTMKDKHTGQLWKWQRK